MAAAMIQSFDICKYISGGVQRHKGKLDLLLSGCTVGSIVQTNPNPPQQEYEVRLVLGTASPPDIWTIFDHVQPQGVTDALVKIVPAAGIAVQGNASATDDYAGAQGCGGGGGGGNGHRNRSEVLSDLMVEVNKQLKDEPDIRNSVQDYVNTL